jgi:hypothetical protein
VSTLHPDLEALMPEPAEYAVPLNSVAMLYPPCDYAKAFGSARFTADQVREAMQAVNERAAKLCEALQDKPEEARALSRFKEAHGRDISEELARGNHWSVVNLFNTALSRAAAAIRGAGSGA